MPPPLILVDGSSYLFRAFHALPPLTNSHGEPTNAMLGVMNMLRRLLNDYQPEYAVVVFDAKGKNFRHKLYPAYKANRVKMPDDLAVQIAPLKKMISALGLPIISIEGVEADDVIGTITQQAVQAGHPVLISTGDKDMAQLIQQHVSIVDTMKQATIDRDYIIQKWGITPEQVVDFLALVGDSADNIPGVPTVGPKTAAKWLQQYHDIDHLTQHADEITGKVGGSLRAHLDQLSMSRQLATIICDVDVAVPLADMKLRPIDVDQLLPQLRHYEFSRWLKDFTPAVTTTTPATATQYTCILDRQAWQTWLKKIRQAKLVAVDTETTSLDAMQAKLVGVSFAVASGEAAYLPLAHDYLGVPAQLNDAITLKELKTWLEDPQIKKIGQHIKYDLKVLARHDIALQGILFDTMLASYVLEAGQNRHNLDALAKKHLQYEMTSYEQVAGKGKKQICFSEVALDTASHYAAEDADITYRLYEIFDQQLKQNTALAKLFYTEEMPTMHVLASMEQHGVLIDADALSHQSRDIEARLQQLEQQAFAQVGSPFNLSSPKQLQEILFSQMALPIIKKTPKGQPSTDESVLQELALSYELPQLIVEHRHLSKLKSTYTDKLPNMINAQTGRVHTSYHQAVASTGRLSSAEPNLQNIPIRSAVGRRIREAFIAPEGYQLVAADYSQVELRIMAHLSQDKRLLEAFARGEDVHRATAAEVFGKAKEDVTPEQRRRAKAINFGLMYGMSAFGLAKQLNIARDEAGLYIKVYFDRYPGVKDYMQRTRQQAMQQGFVETLYGRRLTLTEILSRQGVRRQAAERAAINAPMQGTAADIIKRAMIVIDDWLTQGNVAATMIMQVHDELVFEVRDDQVGGVSERVKELMETSSRLDVPLVVGVGVGKNWEEAH